ncbi:hypothetical protein H8356DRAFT_1648616 [Neocallimastix lanati (nom. inval.)]|nr:hypothetical protein H8356DRAFT_1648616 [Neocallimastix sp. JGI-2020a]
MCKKSLDNEDLEISNEDNQQFTLNANTDFSRIFKLIEDKIKPLSLRKDWELFLYLNMKEKLEKDEETKENTKELKVLDSELIREIEENDKYSIYEKYINAHTELLKQQNKNKSIVDNIEELKEQINFNKKNYDDLYNTYNELISKTQKNKAYVSKILFFFIF